MVNADEIKKEGVRLIEEFSEKLADVPASEETHYVVDVGNVTRKDGKPLRKDAFSKRFKDLAPQVEDDYVVCEKNVH